ncbi:BspA family leucine-rich repeat surface protein [Pedobacter sp. ASV28]|uniref:BspA family leucine-rich repeat surface protein n=1 Tax=Pedobacter sp. ASV28 TaxID=2795123 RepID=UPI0018EC47DE|nr:BspA family leucine-rich repeat surface protein [Pedobacter sp. ASV28]
MTKFYRSKHLFILFLALLLSIHGAFAIDSLAHNQRSLSEVLNPDGTLKQGINGSFNAQGFALGKGKNGQPVFSVAAPTDNDNWDNSASNYIYGTVNAVAVNGADIYVGSNGIFRWTGTRWDVVGGGINITVRAIAVSGNDLYIGGYFTAVGGVAAKGIAKWNGTSWSALGAGVEGGNGTVRSIAVLGTDVYVGGTFESAGGNTAIKYLAKWDGSTWSGLGTNMKPNSYVYTIAVSGADVYVGGDFTAMGSTPIKRIAKWDGTSWSALGTGIDDGAVNAIAVSGTDIYIGGSFTSVAGQFNIKYLAKWDGNAWSTFASTTVDKRVNAIFVSGTNVYVGGLFAKAGSTTVNGIAKWDGTSWKALGTGSSIGVGTSYGSDVEVFGIAVLGTNVYVGGNFDKAGGNTAYPYFAKYDGSTWGTLRVGLNAAVRSVAVIGTNVYVGGLFGNIPGTSNTQYIAKWNGTSWSSLGTGVDGLVSAIAVSGGNIYVGGSFTKAGGLTVNRIAKWDGVNWSALGAGVYSADINNGVNAIAISGNNIYVGGGFTSAGNDTNIKYLAKWDGSSWSSLGTGVNNVVKTIAASGINVYAGGNFTSVGGDANIKYLAKWDGSSWSSLGTGVDNVVNAIAVSGTNVYVGGTFTSVGGDANLKYLAKWNGSSWNSLGTGVDAGVSAIAIFGNEVYVGGSFVKAGGITVNNIAKWDGNNWNSLGSGLNSYPIAIGISSAGLYVGGGFSIAGSSIVWGFAIYHTGPALSNDHTGAFATIWDTSKLPNGAYVSFNTTGSNYEYYWEKIGDETNTNSGTYLVNTNTQSLVLPQFVSGTGAYRLYIKAGSGTFTGFQTYGHATQAKALTAVESWGNVAWTNLMGAFLASENLSSLPANAPDLSQITDLSFMFGGAKLFNQNIGHWNVGNVTNMSVMFTGATSFNQNINGWDVSKVSDMSRMFSGASAFNQNLGDWTLKNDVNLTNMLDNSGLKPATYGLTLKGWAENANTPTNRTLGAVGLTYATRAQAYHDILTNNKNWIINDGGVLPVIMLGFTAKLNGNQVNLKWTTVSEQNNKAFVLSRSADGVYFSELRRVAGAGHSSTVINYAYTDRSPLSGVNYYRLEQVDRDGKVNDIGIEVVNFKLSVASLSAYPNPTYGKLEIAFEKGLYQKLIISDMTGAVLQQHNINIARGVFLVDLKPYPKGMFLITLIGKNGKEVKKVIKL